MLGCPLIAPKSHMGGKGALQSYRVGAWEEAGVPGPCGLSNWGDLLLAGGSRLPSQYSVPCSSGGPGSGWRARGLGQPLPPTRGSCLAVLSTPSIKPGQCGDSQAYMCAGGCPCAVGNGPGLQRPSPAQRPRVSPRPLQALFPKRCRPRNWGRRVGGGGGGWVSINTYKYFLFS